MKNFWLITITIAAKIIWTSPIATWFPSNHAGSGQPHIICPIEKYIRTTKNPIDAINLLFNTGVSLSASASSSAEWFTDALVDAPLSDAPYPAASTAAMMLSGLALPSTPIELVSKLTEHALTPGTLETAFSTLVLQAAQLMPVTLYCSIKNAPFSTSLVFWVSPSAHRWLHPYPRGCLLPHNDGCDSPKALC